MNWLVFLECNTGEQNYVILEVAFQQRDTLIGK